MMKGIHACSLFLFLFLTACSSMGPAPSSPPLAQSWKQRQLSLKQMTHWKLKGAVAVHTPEDGGSASLDWQQNNQTYTISLFGPFGANAVQISGKPGWVTLQTSEGKEFSARNPEELLYAQLGWKLPVSHLFYWTRGLPVPSLEARSEFDEYHRLVRLRQQNWEIWFKQYAVFNQRELPTKIVLKHPQLNIKLVIYQWGA